MFFLPISFAPLGDASTLSNACAKRESRWQSSTLRDSLLKTGSFLVRPGIGERLASDLRMRPT